MNSRLMWTGIVVLSLSHTFAADTAAQNRRIGPPSRGWLGFYYEEVPAERNGAAPLIVIREVVDGSPADRAGLEPADTVVRLNGLAADPPMLVALAASLLPGDTVRVRVRREGQAHDFAVVAAERPLFVRASRDRPRVIVFDTDSLRRVVRVHLDSIRRQIETLELPHFRIERDGPRSVYFRFDDNAFRMHLDSMAVQLEALGDSLSGFDRRFFLRPDFHVYAPSFDSLWIRRRPGSVVWDVGMRAVAGAEFTELNPDLARYFDVEEGLLVLSVAPGTPAARAGLVAGDVVVEADGRPIRDVADLRRVVARSAMTDRPLPVEIVRHGERREIRLPRQD